MVFGRNFCEKRQIGISEPHFQKLGATLDLGWWLVEKPMVDFLFALIELFSLFITVLEVWGEICTTICTQILPLQVPPSTIFGIRKLETLGYPMVKIASHWVPLFWQNTGVWRTDRPTDGQMDRQICRSIAARAVCT